MNQCYGCTTCESADKPLEGFIKNLPLETSHHRVEGQSTKCAFGLKEYVVGFVQTDRAESHRMPREESAVQMQIRSLRETFFVR